MILPDLEILVDTIRKGVEEKARDIEHLPMLLLAKGGQIDIVGIEGEDPRVALRAALSHFKPDKYVLLIEARTKPMKASPEAWEEVRKFKRGDLMGDPEAQDCILVYGVENGGRTMCWIAGIEGSVPNRTVLPWRKLEGVDLGYLVVRKWK